MPTVSDKFNYINRLNDEKGAYGHKKIIKFLVLFMVVLGVFGGSFDRTFPQALT